MSQRRLRGLSAADGIALGFAAVVPDIAAQNRTHAGARVEAERALGALAAIADELEGWAELARAEGRDDEADILEANRLMAEDPVLLEEVERLAADLLAEQAVCAATARHAHALESLPNAQVAARGADIRELGRRAARMLTGAGMPPHGASPLVVFARDLGPADVAELRRTGGGVAGLALAEGAATSHVAVMARSLGLPIVVGLGEDVLAVADGEQVLLDGDRGVVVVAPDEELRRWSEDLLGRRAEARQRLRAERALAPVTRDGRRVTLLCNAAGVADVSAGLAAGAEGVGLLRTELSFLEARAWPDQRRHEEALRPVLAELAGRIATVRTLDFGHDKIPPFLRGVEQRGLALTLSSPDALADQLRAILEAGRETRLRVLFPLVRGADDFATARTLLAEALVDVGWRGAEPELGAMIETPGAVERIDEIAEQADFLSIGTNDLVQYALGLDRELPLTSAVAAADPHVLALVGRTVVAAHARRVAVGVCGEAAGEPSLVPLLLGLGVDELSVAPARLDRVRRVVRALDVEAAAAAAHAALDAGSAEESLALARALLPSAEGVDDRDEGPDGSRGIHT
jgi:phosphoenolpyruvate-protein kinase (PTS system EI component)